MTAALKVLAVGLSRPSSMDELLALGMDGSLFERGEHRSLWAAMVQDRRRERGPDEASLLARWETTHGDWPPFGGLSDLAALLALVRAQPIRRDLAADYVEALAEERARAAATAELREALAAAEQGASSAELAEGARRAIEAARLSRVRAGESPTLQALVDADFVRRLAVLDGTASDVVLRTGLRGLDSLLQIRPGHYVVVAGRPGMGKTHLLLSLARGMSAAAGRPVLFVSIEMSEQALGFRAADSEPRAGLERWHVEEARTAASERWREPHILVDARASSLGQIVSSVRAASARHGICAAVVDYLQLVRAPRTGRENREQVVAHISRELCLAGKEVGVAMIVAAQLNREADKRQNKRPMLAELRESGAIEQDADSVLGLYREGAYDAKSLRKDVCEVHVLKQRHGPIGRRDLYYRPGSGFFADLESEP